MVFVFGSNRAGRHGKGAARYAREVFGARPGQGEGLQNSARALPTKDEKLRTLLAIHVYRFLSHAQTHADTDFRVTAVGTGLAGYGHKENAGHLPGRLDGPTLGDFHGEQDTDQCKMRAARSPESRLLIEVVREGSGGHSPGRHAVSDP